VFLILTGFVNAIKPIKQARAGRVESAFTSLASSCFRRSARLILPCAVATVFSWLICEFGGYKMGHMTDSAWMRDTTPQPSGSVLAAVLRVFKNIYTTWSRGYNELDKNLWPMIFFLKGPFQLYVLLLATVRARPRYRMLIFCGLIWFSWMRKAIYAGLPIFTGALLAEISVIPRIINFSTSRRLICRLPPFFLFIFSCYIMSYPVNHPEWTSWSHALDVLGKALFPKGASVKNFIGIVSVALITLSIVLSAKLQQLFSNRVFLWLGAHSFPIYLIHGPLLRSFLNWMLYAFVVPIKHVQKDKDGNVTQEWEQYAQPTATKFFLVLPVFFAVLFLLAHVWQRTIEPRCAFVTKWLEDTMCGAKEEPSYVPVRRTEDEEKDELSANAAAQGGESVEMRSLLPV
jgi:peptidoglycan/LPS O-acetylase OafA/YrhL